MTPDPARDLMTSESFGRSEFFWPNPCGASLRGMIAEAERKLGRW